MHAIRQFGKICFVASTWMLAAACGSTSETPFTFGPPGNDGGDDGSIGQGGASGSSGSAGVAGTAGAGGSDAGSSGAGGAEGGAAGTAGSSGTGGAAGDGGTAGTGGSAGLDAGLDAPADSSLDAPADTSIEAGCANGTERCNGTVHQICNNGVFVDAPCAPGKVCQPSTGVCIDCTCTPGSHGQCTDPAHIQVCNNDCMSFSPQPCGPAQICKAGACLDQLCTPGTTSCVDDNTWQVCNADGTAYDPGGACPAKQQCSGGSCQSLCDLIDNQPSSVGCSFFALNMDNFNEANADAIVVGNTSKTLTAVVNFYSSPGGVQTLLQGNVSIPPMGQYTFTIPNAASDVIESVSKLRIGGAFRIESDLPVIAYQHSPLQPQATNDASCLIPESTLGNHYIVGSYTDALGSYPSYFNVVATQNGTSVTFTVPKATQGGTGVPALAAGGTATVVMNRYDTLQVVAPGSDVTGAEIQSTAPVAVFGAVECAQVPPGATYCDHVEEQSIPVRSWGRKYVGAHVPYRSGQEHFFWRVLAQSDNTVITTTPAQTGFPKTLNKGQFYEFWTQSSFMFEANQGFAAFQYVSGQDAFNAGTGDPAMITAIPVEQFLSSYVILTPSGYSQNYVQIIRTTADDVLVDGAPVPAGEYSAVGAYTVADHLVSAGPHTLTSASPFGIVGVGYTGVTSYGYPGGFGLKDLVTP